MKRDFCRLILILCALCFQLFPAVGFAQDCAGCKDPALFSRMTGFYIYNATILEFDSFEFWVSSSKTEKVEGRHSSYDYYANEGIKLPSGLQIIRNYTNAAKAIGGSVVYEYEDGGTQYAVLKIVKDGKETWVRVEGANNGIYKLRIVEKQAMNQEVVADAKLLAGSISTTGKAAVYGIYFDTNKSVVKPESEPAIAQIAKMLQSESSCHRNGLQPLMQVGDSGRRPDSRKFPEIQVISRKESAKNRARSLLHKRRNSVRIDELDFHY